MNTRSSLHRLLALAWIIGFPLSSTAANLVVTNLADSGVGSLRAVVNTANANTDADVITFDAALSGMSIRLSSQIVLSNQVTIDGSGLAGGISIIPSGGGRIFEIRGNPVVELNHLTILGGNLFATGGSGGGIFVNAGDGALTLNHCTLAFNYSVQDGGAIAVQASSAFVTTLNDCTIANNTALHQGGGIFQAGSSFAQLTVNNCTIIRNTAVNYGGGIYALFSCTLNNSSVHSNVSLASGGGISAGTLIANNSTLVDNRAREGGGLFGSTALLTNCTVSANQAYFRTGGGFGSPGNSAWVNSIVAGNSAPTNSNFRLLPAVVSNCLTNGDPQIAPLGDYGGPTLTRPPLAGSPAIDAGNDSVTNSLATDQRGYPRLTGAHVDIGAAERQ